MPQFAPEEAKTAIAPITVKPAGLDCQAEIFLGPDETKIATSGRIPFVSTGTAKSISLPITMPSALGTYHGYIDVFTNGIRFLAYKAVEDIVIAAPLPSIDITGFHYVYQGAYTWGLTGIMLHGREITHVGFTFRNNEPISVPDVFLKCRVSVTPYWLIPLDQYGAAMPQPFTAPPGKTKVWYRWGPSWASYPSSATIYAEVWVGGELVATRSLDFTISYD